MKSLIATAILILLAIIIGITAIKKIERHGGDALKRIGIVNRSRILLYLLSIILLVVVFNQTM